MAVNSVTGLKLRFVGSLVEQLGRQLYPSATASVAELVSNAWDADATKVWITIPVGEDWRAESEIVVLDNGHGMTLEQARDAYLIVGRKRRLMDNGLSPRGRNVHGRKGIGKLAAFGTAGLLQCVTVTGGNTTAFQLDYDEIRKLAPSADYDVEPIKEPPALLDPDTGKELASGTRVRLTRLHLKRVLASGQFTSAMARRFAIAASEMQVTVNGTALPRFDVEVEFRFPADGKPPEVLKIEDRWAVEQLDDGQEVKWWIGFTEKPIKDETLQGISILAHGKMAQRPFKFEKGQGTEGQLGQEYLVGEVQADWLDKGVDIEDDLIQSNRDQLQLEDPRLDAFVKWGRQRLAWALRERNTLRTDRALNAFKASAATNALLKDFTTEERRLMLKVAATVAKLPEITAESIDELMRGIVNSRSDVLVREMIEKITNEDDQTQVRMWQLVHEFGLIDARKTLSIVEARLSTIAKLKKAIKTGAREVPEIHNIIREDSWLLDPRWHLLDDEVKLADLDIEYEPEMDPDTGEQLDFLFALRPNAPAPIDQVVVVEIKRGTHPDGTTRKADDKEVEKFHDYVLAADEHYGKSTEHPEVRGLMIAVDYTAKAKRKRKSLEQIKSPRLEFKTWAVAIDETERMHLGWLEVSKKRAAREEK